MDFYAIIPASVRYDRNLPAGAKLLYGEITALANKKGYCWASNGYFADLYGVTKATIRHWISALEDREYISSNVIYKNGSREVSERRLFINNRNSGNMPPTQKYDEGEVKNITTPYQKCDRGGVKNDTHIYKE